MKRQDAKQNLVANLQRIKKKEAARLKAEEEAAEEEAAKKREEEAEKKRQEEAADEAEKKNQAELTKIIKQLKTQNDEEKKNNLMQEILKTLLKTNISCDDLLNELITFLNKLSKITKKKLFVSLKKINNTNDDINIKINNAIINIISNYISTKQIVCLNKLVDNIEMSSEDTQTINKNKGGGKIIFSENNYPPEDGNTLSDIFNEKYKPSIKKSKKKYKIIKK